MKITGNVDWKVNKFPKGPILLDEIFKLRLRELVQDDISVKKTAPSSTIT